MECVPVRTHTSPTELCSALVLVRRSSCRVESGLLGANHVHKIKWKNPAGVVSIGGIHR